MSKLLYVDRVSKKHIVTDSVVVLPDFEGSTRYAERAESVTIISHGVSKSMMNYTLAYMRIGKEVRLFCDAGVFYNEEITAHISARWEERLETGELDKLSRRTWELIKENHIPIEVVRNIDCFLPTEQLSMYDIQIGQTVLPVVKMNTYKPTDLERKEWGVSDAGLAFSKERAKHRYTYTATLYDKLIAWLQLTYYIAHGIAPLYTHEETRRAEYVTPYSATVIANQYENACY